LDLQNSRIGEEDVFIKHPTAVNTRISFIHLCDFEEDYSMADEHFHMADEHFHMAGLKTIMMLDNWLRAVHRRDA
jgi:hypothetical protein